MKTIKMINYICDKCNSEMRIPEDIDITQKYTCPNCDADLDIDTIIPTIKKQPIVQIINNISPSYVNKPPVSSYAVWSMWLGIATFPTCLLTSIPAIICGHIAKSQIKKSNGNLRGNGMATAGLILGYLPFAICLISGFVQGLIGK
jgi:DNA-directed RNA polymerase subunit RPC12/RpoP